MSGFVALFNTAGGPIDPVMLGQMTEFLRKRGPDAHATWHQGCIGLGHTLFKTTWEAEYERQPLTLGQDVWIVADCRVDGREELWGRLGVDDGAKLATTPDSELILRAYLKWGENCVDYLIGDFSFAIWDGRTRKLFCGKDHFGVRLLYYTRVGPLLIVSNTLECVRLHPDVSDELNDLAVVDFLIFGCNWDLDTTFFSAIKKLPGGYSIRQSSGGLPVKTKYWEIPKRDLSFRVTESEVVEEFRELFQRAIGDRLRTRDASIWFSGGLDSTNVAAAALACKAGIGRDIDIKAFCVVFDKLIPDIERQYARAAARALKIPIQFLPADSYQFLEGIDDPQYVSPEPLVDPFPSGSRSEWEAAAAHSRVVLDGQGGDELLRIKDVRAILNTRSNPSLWLGIIYTWAHTGRLPAFGTRWISALRKLVRSTQTKSLKGPPTWIAANRIGRQETLARWKQAHEPLPADAFLYHLPIWASLFESVDGGIENRLPYLDLRLIRFVQRLTPWPWSVSKQLLRELGKGSLPLEVLSRPKSPLAGDPVSCQPNAGQAVRSRFMQSPARERLSEWIDVESWLKSTESGVSQNCIAPLAISNWISFRC